MGNFMEKDHTIYGYTKDEFDESQQIFKIFEILQQDCAEKAVLNHRDQDQPSQGIFQKTFFPQYTYVKTLNQLTEAEKASIMDKCERQLWEEYSSNLNRPISSYKACYKECMKDVPDDILRYFRNGNCKRNCYTSVSKEVADTAEKAYNLRELIRSKEGK